MKTLRARESVVPAVLLLLGALSAPALAQEVDQDRGGPSRSGPLVLPLSELVVDQYVVQNEDPNELSQIASTMIGRKFQIQENGPGSAQVASLRQLGRTIVLYDTKEQVQRLRELLTRLDAARGESKRSTRRTVEYRPRFLSLRSAQSVTQNLVDTNIVQDRGYLILEGTSEEVDETLAMLERIDVPERQVLITCQLVDVDGSQDGPPLPEELLKNLQKLLPGSRFGQAGLAILKTSVGTTKPISVQIETAGKRYSLSFSPVAFDERSGSLTVSDCALMEHLEISSSSQTGVRELFRTNTILHGGEYSVLAATGAQSRLLVVRVTPQS